MSISSTFRSTPRCAASLHTAASWQLQRSSRAVYNLSDAVAAACAAPQARTFSTTRTLAAARGGPIKVAPDFSWRRPFKDLPPAPNVKLITTDFDADAILDTLTSKRVAIDAEPGLRPGISVGDKMRSWSNLSRNPVLSVRDGLVCLADAEGVVLLWTAKMKRVPRRLQEILEDPNMEKETIGAPWLVRTFMEEADFFAVRPRNVVCLRFLAEMGWPHTIEPEGVRMAHDQWVPQFAEQALGIRHAVKSRQESFHVTSLSKETLELLINRVWFTYCLGHEARQRIADRVDGKVARDRTLLRMLTEAVMSRDRVKQLIVEQATADAVYDADMVDEAREAMSARLEYLEEIRKRHGRK